ncbi:MAG: 6,7-dimethyl-8-ribityllumazine synthase [Candidatus Eisenbacteria bacterium]|uniref:6,7-dimethyl-8-ribityllumazine synthase n=1 Tax=Eiseniibacteriota bacterium TaxID=2212470 RepID=A0A538TM72_UNCEI|nr:MAG: 6,7-dimethyl-8-ribityllumazine synthase [Candidatus Eisenbacteria bacterium]
MSAPRTIEGTIDGNGLAIAVVASRFNEMLTERLLVGALDTLERRGVSSADIAVVRVPGAFEIPTAVAHLARSGRWDAVVCLGAVVRGETPHFEWVAGEAARGIARLGVETGVPVLFGIVATDTVEQALDRVGGKHGNRGADAAAAAIEMAHVTRALGREAPK